MRLFIQLENGQPKAWPLIGENVRYLAPANVGFPGRAEAYESVDLSEFGFETFAEVDQPAFNQLTHKVADALPVKVAGVWTRQWQLLALSAAEIAAALDSNRRAAIASIDADADAIRNAVLGGRTTEYQQAEADAQAFKTSGYAGTPPQGVQSWLDAKNAVGAGWTAQQSADDILATAAQWKAAQEAIRAHRLLRKEQVRVATTQAPIDTALAAWAAFRSQIRADLGLQG